MASINNHLTISVLHKPQPCHLVVVAFFVTVKVYRPGKSVAFDIDSSVLNRVQNVYSNQSNCLILICEKRDLLICMDIFDVIL